MSSTTTNSNGFRTARVASLQPPMSSSDLTGPAVAHSDQVAHNDMRNILRLWGATQRRLPDDFCDELYITAIVRQPAALLCVELERVRRNVHAVDVPFDGAILNTQRWPTQDLFTLLPPPPLSFPSDRRVEERHVPGQEEVRSCDDCGGKCKTVCKQCNGERLVPCPKCQGMGQIGCQRCGGAGTQLRAGESFTPCAACEGRGSIPCKRCSYRGQVQCGNCQGDGTIICEKCQGRGKLKRGWALATETWTEFQSRVHTADDWIVDLDPLSQDCGVVESYEWPLARDQGVAKTVRQAIPPCLLVEADRLCRGIVSDQGQLDSDTERLAGLRLQLRGTYIYRVAYQYQGLPGVIVIGGTSNQVLFSQVPKPSLSLKQRFLDWLNRFFSFFGLGIAPSVSRDYIDAVSHRKAHVSDHRLVVPAMEDYGASVALTPAGYGVKVSVSTGSQDKLEVTFDVRIVVNTLKEPILCTVSRLGLAHRDRFPQALAMNHHIYVGQVAVVEDSQTKEEYFAIVDRRPYEIVQEAEYACILMNLSHEVVKIQTEGLLS